MAKKFDHKAKAKRQKIMVAVGGVILLGLLAFQVPRTMKMLHQQGADSAAPASASPASTTTPASSAAAVVSSGGDALADPASVPTAESGQLLAFSRFRSKDPFAQQLDVTCGEASASSCGSGSSASTSPSTTPKKAKADSTRPAGRTTRTPVSSGVPSSPPAKPTTAEISVNGVPESVRVGADFPASTPTFTLVSLTRTSAKIGIAGGSLETGSATVTLTKNKPLTLMNTADGTRYVLRLLSVG